ncbi:MAG: DUF423 domain-containing protein [Pseudomonadota bacterium]
MTSAAAILGFLAVALGAFGAHGLEGRLSPDQTGWWETATLYALVHAVAAVAVGLSKRGGPISWSGWAFIFGAVVFSGTLYAMAIGAPSWFGAITPIGGATLLVGWVLLAVGARR